VLYLQTTYLDFKRSIPIDISLNLTKERRIYHTHLALVVTLREAFIFDRGVLHVRCWEL